MDGNKWRSRAARTTLALTTAIFATSIAVAPPAFATAQKVDHTERLFVNSAPIAIQTEFNADHTPVPDPGYCSQFPGVYRGGKVWADTYVGGSHSIYTQFRMNFWTEYSTAVASAKFAYDRAKVTLACPGALNQLYKGKGTKYGVAAACGLPGAPRRWCEVYQAHPGDVALDLPLIEKCAVKPGGPYPVRTNEWHDLSAGGTVAEAKLYNIDALEQLSKKLADVAKKFGLSINVPVYVDDITSLAGVRNFDHVTGQPKWGNSWQGYGHVQTPGVSEFYIAWFDAAAQKIGKNPYTKPVEAHKAVQALVDQGKSPVVNGARHKDMVDWACDSTPTVAEFLDKDLAASSSGLGQTLSEWVQRETGKTLCKNIIDNPQFRDAAALACRNVLIGAIFVSIDNNRCMNRPTDGIANFVKADLGCSRDTHARRLFTQIRKFLGG